MSFFEFPHTRNYDTDLGWLIKHVGENIENLNALQIWAGEHKTEYKELNDKVDGLINNLVDVIAPWDSSIAYHIFSIVEYQGTNYIAVQDVPVGAMITNTDYWQPANTALQQINAIGQTVNEIKRDALIHYKNVEEMQSDANIKVGAVVRTEGYYSSGDRGGALYLIRDTEPDVYKITLNNGLYAEVIPDNIMMPEQFGAVGDNITDDSTAIQDAINVCGNVLFNREKNYRITVGSLLKSGTHLDLNGSTIRVTDISEVYTPSFKNFRQEDGDMTTGNGNIIIENGTFYGGQLLLLHANNVVIRDVTFIDSWGHTIQLAGSSYITIDNCKFLGSIETGLEAVNFDIAEYAGFPFLPEGSLAYDSRGNDHIIIRNCYFAPEGTIEARKYMDSGIGNHNLTGSGRHEKCTISGNIIIATRTHGIGAFGFYDSEISDNYILMSAGLPIEYGACLDLQIINNRLGGDNFTPEAGIKVTKAAAFSSSINGNTFINSNPLKLYVAEYTNTFKSLQRARLTKGVGSWDITLPENIRVTDINKIWISYHDLTAGTYYTHSVEAYGNNFVDGEKYYLGYDSVMQGATVTVTGPNQFIIRGNITSANARELFVAHEPFLTV